MKIALFDGAFRKGMLPLNYTRPIGDILVGTSTMKEKWEIETKLEVSYAVGSPLNDKFPLNEDNDIVFIYGGLVPTAQILAAVLTLQTGEGLLFEGKQLAFRGTPSDCDWIAHGESNSDSKTWDANLDIVTRPYHLFTKNEFIIQEDLIRFGYEQSVPNHILETNRFIGEGFYISPDAKVNGAILNATDGPIVIEAGAEVMEGSVIRGPFVLKAHGTVKMAAKIYGATTIGKHSKVGGEVGNSVIDNYSNKGHDGYMGNSVIGQWCNLGADTNTSNLKNNYGEVSIWSYENEKITPTGEQFCGLTMGDHAKCSINTMFNTGTVVGVCSNLFQAGFPNKFVPSFSWGENQHFQLEKAYEMAERMMARRKVPFTEIDKAIFQFVAEADRHFFN